MKSAKRKIAEALGLLSIAAISSAQAGLVNNGTLPWGAHTGPGNQYYVTSNASLSGGVWTLSATQPGTSGKKYNSGAIYETGIVSLTATKAVGAQATVNVNNAKTVGCWPAFWMTSTGAWTAEVDIAEWKGSSTIWQNTYDGAWENKLSTSTSGSYKTHIAAKSSTSADAWVYLYINGAWTATHTGSNFVGKSFYIMANLQMEGDSGSPGPASASFTVTGYSAWGF